MRIYLILSLYSNKLSVLKTYIPYCYINKTKVLTKFIRTSYSSAKLNRSYDVRI